MSLFSHIYLLLAVEPTALQRPYCSLVHHADDFMIKPFEVPELVVRLKKALQSKCNPVACCAIEVYRLSIIIAKSLS